MPTNPTIRDVARAAGVAPATASLALRNHPRLRKETCAKVQKAAAKLGYRPNAVVCQLLSQLRASRTPKYQATLGLINASENRALLNEIHTFRDWVGGVRERASALGYGVNEFWLHEKDVPPRRLTEIFRAQNIRGIIVAACMSREALPAGFDSILSSFACVVLGARGVRPALNLACNNQFSTIRRAFDEAIRLGCQRPALVMSEEVDELVERRFSGGFLAAQCGLPTSRRIVPFRYHSAVDVPLTARLATKEVISRFAAWFRRSRPDVILCIHPEVKEWVENLGAAVPGDVGLIHLDRDPTLANWAGMNQNNQLIGAGGIDMLVGQLHRNEIGVPSFPKCLLIESSWVDGASAGDRR